MRKVVLLLVISLSLSICGCNEDDNTVTAEIVGTVEFGRGDCMPDLAQREYSKYNGRIYFVVKEDWDNLGTDGYDLLKNRSVNVRVKQGKLSAELREGTYLVMPEEIYVYSEENTITIKSNEVINRDFKFFMCTSY